MRSRGRDQKWGESQASSIVPSLTPPPHTVPQNNQVGCPTLVNIEDSTPYNVTGAPRQKNRAESKEQIKTPEKEQSYREINNLSDAEFKTLVIRKLTEMVEYGCKIEEEVKAMQGEIKENVQGTNSDRKETRTQISGLDQKEEINIQPEKNEATRTQKNEERLRNLQDNFKHSNI